jgi:hypothetical protein
VPTKNSTFKLSEETLSLLQDLADDLGTSRTEAIRIALRDFQQTRAARRAHAEQFVRRMFERVPSGSTIMIGLDEDTLEPFATIDGRQRRNDITVVGQRVVARNDEFVQVYVVDPNSELKLAVGAIQARRGGWLALVEPLPITLG